MNGGSIKFADEVSVKLGDGGFIVIAEGISGCVFVSVGDSGKTIGPRA